VTLVPNLPIPLNSAGQVGFGAEAASLAISPFLGPQSLGFFLETAGGTPTKVMANGDAVPDTGGTFGAPHFISNLNDNGDLAFTAATNSAADGIFIAPAGGTIQTVALDGTAAPVSGGGSFSLTLPLPAVPPGSFLVGFSPFLNVALMNQERDVAFRSGIIGGSADSGYFRLMQNGASAATLQPVVLQGQAVPGGGTFNTIPPPGNQAGEFALGANGDFAFVNNFTDPSGVKRGLFVARPDGTLVRVLATGDTVPDGGVLNGILMSKDLSAGGAGTFAFWAAISGGNSGEAIYATAVALGTASTTVTLTSQQSSSVVGQQVTLTATVSSTATGAPSGSVSFFDNGVSLGKGAVSLGQAALNISSLLAGAHSIVAQYSGDTNFASSNSSTFAVSVTGFAPPPANLTVTAGNKLVIPLTLYAAPSSNFSFMLSCSALPANTSCAFDQNPVTPGPGGTAIKATLSTMGSSNLLPDRSRKDPGPLGLLELSAILSAILLAGMIEFWRAPRRRLAFSMCLAVFALALVMVGCAATSSNSGSPGTPKGPASFTVTGTSGATTVTTVVNVTVQ
jgi:hypothetical protein